MKKYQYLLIPYSFNLFTVASINFNYQFTDNDDDIFEQICQALQSYHLTIYASDINDWDNPQEIEKIIIYELQQAISFLKIDQLVPTKMKIDYQKIKLSNGYKLDLEKKHLLVNLQYGKSVIKKINFHAFNIKRIDVIEAINKKIAENIDIKEIYENNWSTSSFVNNLGNHYLKKLLKVIGQSVEIGANKIAINYQRIFFQSWENQKLLKYQIIFQYRYFWNAPLIVLPVNLQHVFNIEKIFPNIISLLKKSNLLQTKINKKINWNDQIDWLQILNDFLFNWQSIISEFLNKFKYENIFFDWQILKISPFGPFDQSVTIFLNLNGSKQTVPLEILFDYQVEKNAIISLKQVLQNKLANLFIKNDQIKILDFQKLTDIIKQSIGRQIVFNDQIIPFNSDNLKIENYQIIKDYLIVDMRLKNNLQIFNIKINLI